MKKGVLRKQLLGSSQLLFHTISVQNNSGKFLELVTVECGFIQDSNIVGSGVQIFSNLKAGETAYGEVVAQVGPGYEGKNIVTECRLSNAVLPD